MKIVKLLALSLMILLFISVPSEAGPFPINAIAAYDMETTLDGNLVDITGHGHNSSNSAVQVQDMDGKALYFNGGEEVRILSDPALNLSGPFSIMVSFKLDTVVADWVSLIGKGHQLARNYGLWVSASPSMGWEGFLAQVMPSVPQQDNAFWGHTVDYIATLTGF